MNRIVILSLVVVAMGCSSSSKKVEEGQTRRGGRSPSRNQLAQKASEQKYSKLTLALRTNNDKDVEAAASQLLAQDANDVMVLNALAMHHFRKGRLGLTKLLLKQAYDLQPNSSAIQNNLGLVFLEENDLQAALLSFKEALSLDDDNSEAAANLGSIYARYHDCEKALPLLKQAYADNFRTIDVLANYSECLGTLSRPEADGVYKQALNQDPRNTKILLNYAIYLIERKQKIQDGAAILGKLKFAGVPKEMVAKVNELDQILSGSQQRSGGRNP